MGNKKCDCKKPTIGNVSSICPIHGIGYFDSYWKKLTHLYNIIFRPKRLWESNGWAELQSTKIFPFISEEGLRGEKFVCWKTPSSWAEDNKEPPFTPFSESKLTKGLDDNE